jgi:hypothetical protein
MAAKIGCHHFNHGPRVGWSAVLKLSVNKTSIASCM